MIQPPIYPPFRGAPRDHKRRVLENPLVWGEDGYRVDLEGLRAVVDEGTRILLLCNPHNPTVRVFSREELLGIAEVAMERDLVVVSDEIHMDLVYPGNTHIPFATLSPEVEARTITLTSASKSFNVAGLRTAVAVFGSEALKRRCLYLFIDYPSVEQELAVVRLKVPELSPKLARQSVELVHELRSLDLRKSPSISETLDWAKALVTLNADQLDAKTLETTLSVLLKHERDLQRVRRQLRRQSRRSQMDDLYDDVRGAGVT